MAQVHFISHECHTKFLVHADVISVTEYIKLCHSCEHIEFKIGPLNQYNMVGFVWF